MIGWAILATGGNVVLSWLTIGFFGLGAIMFLILLVLALTRRPVLLVTGDGIGYSAPLYPWIKRFVPWSDVARIGINIRRLSSWRSMAYFVVETRHPTSSTSQRLMASMYPAMARAAIIIALSWLFLVASRKRQGQMLDRIATTFASEIIQYSVFVDKTERRI